MCSPMPWKSLEVILPRRASLFRLKEAFEDLPFQNLVQLGNIALSRRKNGGHKMADAIPIYQGDFAIGFLNCWHIAPWQQCTSGHSYREHRYLKQHIYNDEQGRCHAVTVYSCNRGSRIQAQQLQQEMMTFKFWCVSFTEDTYSRYTFTLDLSPKHLLVWIITWHKSSNLFLWCRKFIATIQSPGICTLTCLQQSAHSDKQNLQQNSPPWNKSMNSPWKPENNQWAPAYTTSSRPSCQQCMCIDSRSIQAQKLNLIDHCPPVKAIHTVGAIMGSQTVSL